MIKDYGLTEVEIAMFAEMNLILNKYKSATRSFGIQLLHEHFPINANEVLHETNCKTDRTLTLETLCSENIPTGSIATAWTFDRNGKPQALVFCCDD